MKRFLALAAVVLTGCAGAPETFRLAKPGATYDEFLKARFACIQSARSQETVGAATGAVAGLRSSEIVRTDIYLACMNAAGYQRAADGFEPPAGASIRAQ